MNAPAPQDAGDTDRAGASPGRSPGGSLVVALTRLRDALTALEATDPDHDSTSYDHATDALISVAREAVAAAGPVLRDPARLSEAVADGAWFRHTLVECLCRSATCPTRADSKALAAAYRALLPSLTVQDRRADSSPG